MRQSIVGILVLLCGCSASQDAPTSPTPTAKVTVAPTADTSTPTAPAVPEEVSFTEVAELPPLPEHGSYGELHATKDALWLSMHIPLRFGTALYTWDGERFTEREEMFIQIVDAVMPYVHHFFDGAKGELHLFDAETGGPLPNVHHRISNNGEGWTVKEGFVGYMPLRPVRRGGATFTMLNHYMAHMSGFEPSWYGVSGSLPSLKLAKGDCPKEIAQPTLMTYEAITSTPNGTIVAFGKKCGTAPAVEIWPANSDTSQVTTLPLPAGVDLDATPIGQIHAASDSDIRIVGPALWHLRRGKWIALPLPREGAPLTGGRFTSDGTLFASIGFTEWYRHVDNLWSRIDDDASARSIITGPKGKTWALNDSSLLELTVRPPSPATP